MTTRILILIPPISIGYDISCCRSWSKLNSHLQTLAIDAFLNIRCVHCHNDTIRPDRTNVVDLVYQPLVRVVT